MNKLIAYAPYITMAAGVWALVNGILHDIFILIPHKKPYDRDLLRLLMDGHILITCGLVQMLVFNGLQQNQNWALAIATSRAQATGSRGRHADAHPGCHTHPPQRAGAHRLPHLGRPLAAAA